MKQTVGLVLCLLVGGLAVGHASAAGDCQVPQLKRPPLRMAPRADLQVRLFQLSGDPVEARVSRGDKTVRVLKQAFRLTVKNVGQAPAGPHRIQVNYEVPGVNTYRLYLRWNQDAWFLAINRSIEPGHSWTINGYVYYEDSFRGTRGEVYALVDVRDEEFMPDYGRVWESDEKNNQSVRVPVILPAFFQPAAPRLQAQPGSTLNLNATVLGIFGSLLEGQLHLNNDNGHSDDDHFTPHNPFRSNDCFLRINDYHEAFNLPEIWFELGAMDYHYYVRDLDAQFGGSRGRDLLGIRDGNLIMTIRFETGGRVELRGWEYTGGIFYDLSAPDMEITRLDVLVFLTLFLREDGVLTYTDARVTTDLQVRFIGAYDTVLMNDILMRARSRISGEINGQLRTFLLSDGAKGNFEIQVMAGLQRWITMITGRPFTRLTGMTVAGDRITITYR